MSQLGAPAHEKWAPTAQTTSASSAPISAMATEVASARDEGDALELGEDLGDDGPGNEDGCAASLQAVHAYADIQELSAAAMIVFERWRCQQLACCDAPEETSRISMDKASAPSSPPAVSHVEGDFHGASVTTGLENDRVRFIRPVPANVVQASRLWDSSLLLGNGESSLVDKLLVSAGCSQVLPGVVDIARCTDIEGALCDDSLRQAGLAHMASRLDMWPSVVARIHALDRVPNVLKHYDL